MGVNHRRLNFEPPASRLANAVSDRFISAATSCIHRLISGLGKHANRRGIARVTPLRERVDLADADAHEMALDCW